MSKSHIEWTEDTWNPIVGCSIVSPGCTNCYAMKMAARIEAANAAARPGHGTAPQYDGTTKQMNGNPVWTGKIAFASDSILLQPLKRKKPTVYFVNSMGDLFHEDVPDAAIDRVIAIVQRTPHHTYQVLTKRAQRMRDYFAAPDLATRIHVEGHRHFDLMVQRRLTAAHDWPLPNLWLGVSTERQQEADARIPLLLQTLAAVRFISAEPLLGPIDLTAIQRTRAEGFMRPLDGRFRTLDWVIAGGESGPGARPMHPDWARSLRDQCAAANVPFFFKQWGAWTPDTGPRGDCDPIFEGKGPCAKLADGRWEFSENGFTMPLGGDGEWMYRLGKKAAGKLLDGIEHQAMPASHARAATP